MFLTTTNDTSFELKLLGYQYPHKTASADYWDANWLIVKITVIHPSGSWQASEACLTTFEIERLIQWLTQIKTDSVPRSSCTFTEPALSFEVVDTGPLFLRVFLNYEFRPPWAPETFNFEKDIWIDFPLSEIDLSLAIDSLKTQLQNYPQRASQ